MKMYRVISQLTWTLGLLSLVAAVVVKLLVERVYPMHIGVEPRTLVIMACAFFLCTLATREMARP